MSDLVNLNNDFVGSDMPPTDKLILCISLKLGLKNTMPVCSQDKWAEPCVNLLRVYTDSEGPDQTARIRAV